MTYTINPNIPKVRQEATQLVKRGWGIRKTARRFGVSPGTITKWVKKAKIIGNHPIPTLSSKPKSHPKGLSNDIIKKIINKRLGHNRCSEVVHRELENDGIKISLSSVKRTLNRHYLIKKRSPWKRYHPHQERPYPLKSGDLVETDTIHRMIDKSKRLYVFTLIDIYSRWVYAKAYERINSAVGVSFIQEAQLHSSFHFNMIQSDHGPEFGKWFVERIQKNHRYTRIGKPNDNSHIERFNRTLQEELLDKLPNDVKVINCELKKYLQYYNNERLHLGIDLKTPVQLTKCFQAIE